LQQHLLCSGQNENFANAAQVIDLFDLPRPRFSQSISRGFWDVRFTRDL